MKNFSKKVVENITGFEKWTEDNYKKYHQNKMQTICLTVDETDLLKDMIVEQVAEGRLSPRQAQIIDTLAGKLMADFEEPTEYPDKFISADEQSLEDNLK